MRFKGLILQRYSSLTGVRRRRNQGIALILAAMVAACGGDAEPGGKTGLLGGWFEREPAPASADDRSALVGGDLVFFGVVAADEPVAVQAAEDILRFGGTAADAAVALALTLTVTKPSMASLGGGGVCVVHDPTGANTEVIDFIAPPGSPIDGADRPSAVPTLLRGLAALHARYGQTDFRTLLAGVEKKARFGTVMSRAAARDLALAAKPLFNDPEARRIFARADGAPVAEGDRLFQADLAETYAVLRTDGINSFYKGDFAARLVAAVAAAGGTLTREDLRRYLPRWRKAVLVPYREQVLAFAPPPAGVGVGGALMWNMLAGNDRYRAADPAARAHLLVEASKRAFAARPRWLGADDAADYPFASRQVAEKLMANFDPARATPAAALDPKPRVAPENPAGAGFVVVDLVGQAVACTLTNYGFYGTGRIAPGTGILLAAAPGRGDRNALSLGPVITYESGPRSFRLAVAGSGGAATLTATMSVLAASILDGAILEKVVRLPRVHHGGLPDVVLAEKSVPDAVLAALRGRGHRVTVVPDLGRVNAAECPLGLDATSDEVACFVHADPRGFGIAAEAER
jgi:gamma-glutamyltranspeptidase/glutathione hydrolase